MKKNPFYYYERGKEEYFAGDYEKASSYFETFLKYYDNFADVYNYLGFIYFMSGDVNLALEHYKRAVKLNPYYTEALMNLIVILHDIGEYQEAEKYLKNLKESKTINGVADKHCIGKLANMHAEIANVYKTLAMYDEAVKEFDKALNLAPNFPDIRLWYANLLRDMGRLQDAVREYEKVLEYKPNYVEAIINLGITYYKLGYFGYCLDMLKKAKKLDKDNKKLKALLYLLENSKEVG